MSPRTANALSWLVAGVAAFAVAACVFVLGLFLVEALGI